MKKISMFWTLVMSTICIILVVSTSAVAQKSTILVGDKDNSEVKLSAKNFKDLISDIDHQMRNLEKENKIKIAGLTRNTKSLLRNPSLNQYMIERNDVEAKKYQARTDSLIAVAQQNKSNLGDELASFIIKASGKDKQKTYHLQSRDITKAAKAIGMIEYYEDKKNGANNNIVSADSVLIMNDWIDDAYISVSNQTGFCISFKLESKARQVVAIPGPGDYSVLFRFGGRTKSACTNFDGYTRKGFDRKTQKTYAFLAGLPSKL